MIIILILLLLYYGALAFGYLQVRGTKSWLHSVGTVLVGFAVGLFTLAALINRGPGSAFPMVGLSVGIFFPLFLTGLGLAVGAFAKVQKFKGHETLSRIIFWTPTLLLSGLFIWTVFQAYGMKKDRASTQIMYQSLTIEEILGPHNITVPISPQLKIIHQCNAQKQVGDIRLACSQKEYSESYEIVDASERQPSAPYLYSISIFSSDVNCTALIYNLNGCIPRDDLLTWCNRRKELQDSIWCNNTLPARLTIKEFFEPNKFSLKRDSRNWADAGQKAIGNDWSGNPIKIKCSITRDTHIAHRTEAQQEARKLMRLCRVKFLIDEKIVVESQFESPEDAQLTALAESLYFNANAFWDDMKTRSK